MSARMYGTWLVRHGLIRGGMKVAARFGDLHARLSYAPEARWDPYPTYAQMRAGGSGLYRGWLTVATASHDAASQILRNDAMKVGFDDPEVPWILRKTMTRGRGSKLIGPIDYPSLLVVNAPEHTMLRRQVSKVFTPRNVGRLDDHIQKACTSLLDDIEKNHDGEIVDVVDNYSGLLPVMVVCDILGIPNEMRYKFLEWGNSAASSLDAGLDYQTFLACENGVKELNTWMFEHIHTLRATPDDSLLSQLIHAEDAGTKLTDTQIMATVSLTLAAGFETTVNMITSGAHLLATHPEARQALAADPGLWANAIEEILRYEAPVQETMRLASKDLVINGFTLKKGDFVGVMMGAANRDPAVFEDPDRFDIRRENAREHMTFSAGVHFCIGSVLARAEGRIALQTLFDRYPDLTVNGTPTYRNTRTLRGFRHLPMRLRRADGAGAQRETRSEQRPSLAS